MARKRTQAERREEAETRLLNYAAKLVAERGYDGFTLADVAEAAGYSRGLPAHYFGRKEDLLSRVAEFAVENYHRKLAELPQTDEGLPRIEAMIRSYVRSRGAVLRTLQILFSEALVQPSLRETISTLNATGFKTMEEQLRAGIEKGNIRPDVDVSLQAAVIYSFLRGQMAFAGLDPSFEEVAVGEEFIATIRTRLAPKS